MDQTEIRLYFDLKCHVNYYFEMESETVMNWNWPVKSKITSYICYCPKMVFYQWLPYLRGGISLIIILECKGDRGIIWAKYDDIISKYSLSNPLYAYIKIEGVETDEVICQLSNVPLTY